MKTKLLIFALGLSVSLFQTRQASAQDKAIDLNTKLPVDSKVRIGKLDNGLVYYIRQNAKPEKRVELRLVVKAGSILETDAQQGLAHFTEHMCFNGTKTFPKNELVDFLQKIGVKFGAEINAVTVFDQTVYKLQIPTDKEGLLDKGYQVIEDWAHNVTFEGSEIDNERGVITEEWRGRLGANDRMMKKYLPVILKDSKYAGRLPIGQIDVIKNCNHDTLRKFYHDWYRPNLQAVIIVGDVNLDSAEAKIKQHFNKLTNPDNPKQRISFDIPNNTDPLIAIETDKEATNNLITIYYKYPDITTKTIGDFRTQLMKEIYTEMLNARLSEISNKQDAPFNYAYTYNGNFYALNCDAFTAVASSKENQIDKSISSLLTENQRVKLFGFLQSEFERQKEAMLNDYEKAANEADKTESENFCNDYVNNFLTGEAIPGAKAEYKIVKKLLPEIKLEEINALAKSLITDNNIAMVITAPEKEGIKVPAKEQVLKIFNDVKSAKIEAYVDKFKAQPLVSDNLTGSKIISQKEIKDLGVTELTLGNGVQVILKPTDFKNDEIQVNAYSPGGTSLYPDQDYISAYFASTIINQSGVGEFDNTDLEKKLKGKDANISPLIDEIEEGFTGKSTPKDFETLLQLTYLYFKAPRKDTAAFNSLISKMKDQSKSLLKNPMNSFIDTLIKSEYPNTKRLLTFLKTEQIEKINLDVAYKIYTDRFADASDFKFFIVGNFNIDTIKPMLEKYLGSLPSINRKETWKDVSPKFATGITDFKYNKGMDDKGMVKILMSGNLDWNLKNKISVNLLSEILSIKLIEVVREKMGGVYSPQSQIAFKRLPETEYDVTITLGCSPTQADNITTAVFDIMKDIQKNGPTQVDFDKAKESIIKKRETNLKMNIWWLYRLKSAYFNGEDPEEILKYDETIKAITLDDIKLLSQKVFTENDHYVRGVLLPEKK